MFSTCRLAITGVCTTVKLKKNERALGTRNQHYVNMSLTQQSPLPGQSVSLCPGLQQVETAPAHSSGLPGDTAGHEPTSSPPPEPPAVPNAPSAPP